MLYNTIIKFIVEAKHKLYGHKESAGPVHISCQALHSPKYTMEWSLRNKAQLQQYIDMLVKSRFEVQVRVRDWAIKRFVTHANHGGKGTNYLWINAQKFSFFAVLPI